MLIAHIYDSERLAHYGWRQAAFDNRKSITHDEPHNMMFVKDGIEHWYMCRTKYDTWKIGREHVVYFN